MVLPHIYDRNQVMIDLKDEVDFNLDRQPRCEVLDDDCDEVPCKLTCYLLDPAKGYCPYLESKLEFLP